MGIVYRDIFIAPSASHHPKLRATFLQRKARLERAPRIFINAAEPLPAKPSLGGGYPVGAGDGTRMRRCREATPFKSDV